SADHVTIQNSGGGSGIALDTGAVADIANSTILDNAETGIGTSRGSVITLSGNTISGSPEGVFFGTGSVGWLDGNTISTSISADSFALGVAYGSIAKLNGGNTLTSTGFALYAQQGSTLIQHHGGHDRITGPVQITIDSNAEFRNVEITGPV